MSSSSILSSTSVDELYRKWCLTGSSVGGPTAPPPPAAAGQSLTSRTGFSPSQLPTTTTMVSPRPLENRSSFSSLLASDRRHQLRFAASPSPSSSMHRSGEMAAAHRALLDRIQNLEDSNNTATTSTPRETSFATRFGSVVRDATISTANSFCGNLGEEGASMCASNNYTQRLSPPSTTTPVGVPSMQQGDRASINNSALRGDGGSGGDSGAVADLAQQLMCMHDENRRLRQRVEDAYRAADSKESDAIIHLREKHRQEELRWVQETEYLRQRARTYETATNDAKAALALTQSRVEQLKAAIARQEAAAEVRERELLATVAVMERDMTTMRLASSRNVRRVGERVGSSLRSSSSSPLGAAQQAALLSPPTTFATGGEAFGSHTCVDVERLMTQQRQQLPLSPEWVRSASDASPVQQRSPVEGDEAALTSGERGNLEHYSRSNCDDDDTGCVHRAVRSADPEHVAQSLAACVLPPSSPSAASPSPQRIDVEGPAKRRDGATTPSRAVAVAEVSCSSAPSGTSSCSQCLLAQSRLERAREELLASTTQWSCVAEEVAAFAAAVLEGARRGAQD